MRLLHIVMYAPRRIWTCGSVLTRLTQGECYKRRATLARRSAISPLRISAKQGPSSKLDCPHLGLTSLLMLMVLIFRTRGATGCKPALVGRRHLLSLGTT